MIDLHRYFQNPFDDTEISLDGLLAFRRIIAVSGLRSGARYAFRVRAIGAAGPSPGGDVRDEGGTQEIRNGAADRNTGYSSQSRSLGHQLRLFAGHRAPG